MPVSALAIEKSGEPQTQSTISDHTSYNASEPAASAIHPNDASQKEATKVVIDFDLPSAQRSSESDVRKKDDDGTTPILKLIINQSDGISVNASRSKLATTDAADTADDSQKETTTSQQQLLIPPATVNASIAQMPSAAGTHKNQGQIIIR